MSYLDTNTLYQDITILDILCCLIDAYNRHKSEEHFKNIY
jgi:hypothetical protein